MWAASHARRRARSCGTASLSGSFRGRVHEGAELQVVPGGNVTLLDVGCMALDMLSYVDRCDLILTVDAVDGTGDAPHFGREFCRARNPRCADCIVGDLCPTRGQWS